MKLMGRMSKLLMNCGAATITFTPSIISLLAHFSVRDLWNGRRVCLSVVCPASNLEKLRNTGAKCRHHYRKSGSESIEYDVSFCTGSSQIPPSPHTQNKWPKMWIAITKRDRPAISSPLHEIGVPEQKSGVRFCTWSSQIPPTPPKPKWYKNGDIDN